MAQPGEQEVSEFRAVLAESVHAGPGEDEACPAAVVFYFLVPAPDGPVILARVSKELVVKYVHPIPQVLLFPV